MYMYILLVLPRAHTCKMHVHVHVPVCTIYVQPEQSANLLLRQRKCRRVHIAVVAVSIDKTEQQERMYEKRLLLALSHALEFLSITKSTCVA